MTIPGPYLRPCAQCETLEFLLIYTNRTVRCAKCCEDSVNFDTWNARWEEAHSGDATEIKMPNSYEEYLLLTDEQKERVLAEKKKENHIPAPQKMVTAEMFLGLVKVVATVLRDYDFDPNSLELKELAAIERELAKGERGGAK